jgi:hypothetical protein
MNITEKVRNLMQLGESHEMPLEFNSGELIVKVKSRRDKTFYVVREEITALEGSALVVRGTFPELVLAKMATDDDLEFDSGEIVVKLESSRRLPHAGGRTIYVVREEITSLEDGGALVVRGNLPGG